jgi:phosphate transport system substrate-binding protein
MRLVFGSALLGALLALAAAAAPGDALVAAGSDAMAPLLERWAEDLAEAGSPVRLEIDARGSTIAPPALVSGRAALAAMSREMRWTELEVFRSRYGHDPMRLRLALDAVVVFVHPSNGLDALSLAQLDSLYSSTLRCGAVARARRWADVGSMGGWGSRAVHVCGLGRLSGTRGFFRERALCGGYFREDVREQPGSRSVLRFVAEGLCGIGYAPLSADTSGVRVLRLGSADGSDPVSPSPETIYAGSYPLRRYLNVYVNRSEGRALAGPLDRLLRHALSRAGQAAVAELGYLPLPEPLRQAELARLDS